MTTTVSDLVTVPAVPVETGAAVLLCTGTAVTKVVKIPSIVATTVVEVNCSVVT